MQFFEHQDQARSRTGLLITLFCVAVLALGLLSALATHLALTWTARSEGEEFAHHDQAVICAAILTWGVIFLGSAYKLAALRGGGARVAESLGGTLIAQNTTDPLSRRALNVVEEMAIAAGLPVPPVYLLRNESGINAFAAGWSIDDAVIAVTMGALEELSRDQLQGVIAHEFSHILNRDCALNMRLLGVLHGIVLISGIGRTIMWLSSGSRHRSVKKEGGAVQFYLLGVAIWLFGSLGVVIARLIQAGVSQQREFLADASAVQFTRNPWGISGALAKIASASSALSHPHAKEASHMLVSSPDASSFAGLLASHPPLFERIHRILPAWDGNFSALSGRASSNASRFGHGEGAGHGSGPDEPDALDGELPLIDLPVLVTATSALAPGAVERPQVLEATSPVARSGMVDLARASRDPFSCRALLLSYVLDDAAAANADQYRALDRDPALAAEVRRLAPALGALSFVERLALFDRTLSTLAALSPAQTSAFLRFVLAMRNCLADDSYHGYCFASLIIRHLDANASNTSSMLIKTAVETAIGVLARRGHSDLAEARAAFSDGIRTFAQRKSTLQFPDEATLNVRTLDSALATLKRLPLGTRRNILDAAESVAMHDGVIEPSETELLRVMAASLDVACPLVAPRADLGSAL